MAARALITPDVLSWARDRAHISVEVLAAKIQTTADRLQSWESGEATENNQTGSDNC